MFYSPQLREVDSLLAMKERQKSAKAFLEYFNSCNKHPYSPSSVGICPLCLSDRLMKLACSDCGERRVSSCSCSEFSSSSFRNSCSKVDVGSVGRISFLIDNDHKRPSFLRSSSSSGFWRMLRKRGNKDKGRGGENSEMGSFRNNIVDGFWRNGYGARDEGGFAEENGFGLNGRDIVCVNEMEDGGLGVGGCSSFLPEKDINIDERGGFIELKLDSWYDLCDDGDGDGVGYNNIASLRRNGINSGSCRITMKEKGLKQGKLWKWISKFR